jgi:hypothetical protein
MMLLDKPQIMKKQNDSWIKLLLPLPKPNGRTSTCLLIVGPIILANNTDDEGGAVS